MSIFRAAVIRLPTHLGGIKQAANIHGKFLEGFFRWFFVKLGIGVINYFMTFGWEEKN